MGKAHVGDGGPRRCRPIAAMIRTNARTRRRGRDAKTSMMTSSVRKLQRSGRPVRRSCTTPATPAASATSRSAGGGCHRRFRLARPPSPPRSTACVTSIPLACGYRVSITVRTHPATVGTGGQRHRLGKRAGGCLVAYLSLNVSSFQQRLGTTLRRRRLSRSKERRAQCAVFNS